MLALLADIVRRLGKSVVLSSHVLPDVEQVCSFVLVVDEGRAKAQGAVATLVGPRRFVYDVQLRGDAAAFRTDLADEGAALRESDDGWRIELPPGMAPERIFAIATGAHVQVRRLRPSVPTLEDVFLKAVAH